MIPFIVEIQKWRHTRVNPDVPETTFRIIMAPDHATAEQHANDLWTDEGDTQVHETIVALGNDSQAVQ